LAINDLLEQYAFPVSSDRPDGALSCWDRICKARVLPKVKVSAWKAAQNALPTEDNKRCRGMNCNICGREKDNVHALFGGTHAFSLWTAMQGIQHLPSNTDVQVNPHNWF
jgi:hypothetical protein